MRIYLPKQSYKRIILHTFSEEELTWQSKKVKNIIFLAKQWIKPNYFEALPVNFKKYALKVSRMINYLPKKIFHFFLHSGQ